MKLTSIAAITTLLVSTLLAQTTPTAKIATLSQPPLLLDRKAWDAGARQPFKSYISNKPFGTYLQVTLDYAPFKPLYDALKRAYPQLQSRGEAHITVINPQEYDQVLSKAGVRMSEINEIAKRANIQAAKYTISCLGRSRLSLDKDKPNVKSDTYYLVLSSPALVKIRQEVNRLYLRKGGEPSLFSPEAFWPHITVGYTTRDVFLFPDGVFKGTNTCWRKLAPKSSSPGPSTGPGKGHGIYTKLRKYLRPAHSA